MKISGYGSITPANTIKKRGGASQAGAFSELLAASGADEASGASHAGEVAATAPLNNLLALQEISEDEVQRKKVIQQGNNLLDTLERLRSQLLIGSLPAHLLLDLGRQLSIQKQLVNDPKLAELIDDIELRAAVELAKLHKALSDRTTE